MSRKNKQQGVVLLSCLVFLLLLLTLLRFNLNSTAMQEMKTGADYDQFTAQETTARVIAAAELQVLSNFGKLTGDLSAKENAEKMMAFWTAATVPDKVIDGDTNPSSTIDWSNLDKVNEVKVKNTVTNQDEVLGEYVVERFMGDGAILAMGAKEKDTVILRITARGYGVGDMTTKNNRSFSTVQNTYILSKAN